MNFVWGAIGLVIASGLYFVFHGDKLAKNRKPVLTNSLYTLDGNLEGAKHRFCSLTHLGLHECQT